MQNAIANYCSPEIVFELEDEAEGASQVLAMLENISRQLEFLQKGQAELKQKSDYIEEEASSLLYEKDKIIDDLSVRIQDLMTSSDA